MSMCNEYYLRRRREADETRAIWQEFEGAKPVDEPEPLVEAGEPEPTELRDAIAAAER
jgi:hypothetical protein